MEARINNLSSILNQENLHLKVDDFFVCNSSPQEEEYKENKNEEVKIMEKENPNLTGKLLNNNNYNNISKKKI